MQSRVLFLGLAMIASCDAASAATLTFRGAALSSCALGVPVDGTLQLGADLSSWTTLTPASISATNTAPATLTVTKPTDWASAPAQTPTTAFTMTASTTGVNVGTLTGGGPALTQSLSAIGVTVLSVSLGATAAAPYRAGLHTAEVTVTCAVP